MNFLGFSLIHVSGVTVVCSHPPYLSATRARRRERPLIPRRPDPLPGRLLSWPPVARCEKVSGFNVNCKVPLISLANSFSGGRGSADASPASTPRHPPVISATLETRRRSARCLRVAPRVSPSTCTRVHLCRFPRSAWPPLVTSKYNRILPVRSADSAEEVIWRSYPSPPPRVAAMDHPSLLASFVQLIHTVARTAILRERYK